MKRLALLIMIVMFITGCGSFGLQTSVFDMEAQGDNGIVFVNDEDVYVLPDGSIKSNITTITVIKTQPEEDTATIFSDAFQMLSDFFKEHAGVYKNIDE